jgi:hypothetical protein
MVLLLSRLATARSTVSAFCIPVFPGGIPDNGFSLASRDLYTPRFDRHKASAAPHEPDHVPAWIGGNASLEQQLTRISVPD